MQPEDQLKHFHTLLLKWQKTINLVSPTTINDAWNRHFEDSRQLADHIPDTVKTICDIGSGAGFPALVLAILRPEISFDLIESDARKCAFLQTVSRETGLDNVIIHNGRIENVIDEIKADCVTSRALASLRQLIRYTEPLWVNNPDLCMILPKGANYESELSEARQAFDFGCDIHPSLTDTKARILTVNNIVRL